VNQITRRTFVHSAAAAAMISPVSRVLGANDDVRIAIIGCGGRGRGAAGQYKKLKGARVVALCDPDESRSGKEAKKHQGAKAYTDLRRVMDDKEVDAVVVATCNHWHALAGIWACQAGKDAYVEKPVSHNIWEGRKLVEAARKYKRIVQGGTQQRSDHVQAKIKQFIDEGTIGKVLYVRANRYGQRGSIGKRSTPLEPPKNVDYDLWLGPAADEPLYRKQLHYDWHWMWNTGNGDLGNQGIHQMDVGRWFLNVNELSPAVTSVGGRLGYDDAGDTANTQIVYHEYAKAPLIFEVRGLPDSHEKFKSGKWGNQHMGRGYRGAGGIGVVAVCEGGYMAVNSYSSGKAYDNDGKKIKSFNGGGDHYANFYKAVQSRKHTDLNADIEEGHLSSALCHTGNVSYKLGKSGASAGEILERFNSSEASKESIARLKDHLDELKIPFNGNLTLGPRLTMDPKTERFTGEWADKANPLLTRPYRKPFVVPDLG